MCAPLCVVCGVWQANAVRGMCDLREVASLPLQQTWGRTSWLGPHVRIHIYNPNLKPYHGLHAL
jgi:hypothetical protein